MPDTLVTGATGLLGATLTRALVTRGADVRILRRPTSPLHLLDDVAGAVEHVEGDITDALSVREAMRGIRRVYHVAALIRFGGRADRQALRAVNVRGTAHVVNAALAEGLDRLAHVSSMAALGRPVHGDGLVDESHPWTHTAERSVYAVSKRDSELEVHRGIAEGLDAVIVNPALIFGPGRSGENTQRMVEAVREERVPAVPPGGTNVVDVRDVAHGLIRAMHLGPTGTRYFLGSENLSFQEIFETLAVALGVAPPQRHAPALLVHGAAAVAEGVATLTGTRPLLSREQARSATTMVRYSNRKARTELECTFRPFRETARWLAERLG
ncbi:MAG: NAD-dependent epimerase/dehydratase family protein [Bacteroidetes bacterium]|nr:NAD-dependent epimerase/dehydratase family protein [Bacteroidota bacterium]